jgi:phosphoribosyl-ATP pyrophosphohydrolase/phosphoribosyl-AMP cyclohydrolase
MYRPGILSDAARLAGWGVRVGGAFAEGPMEQATDTTLDAVTFDAEGLVAAIVQHAADGEVRMVGYMNREALARTLSTRQVWFWSRSRGEFWRKGATSGNTLAVEEVRLDCDGDAILVRVAAHGPTCHTGARSCFFRRLDADGTPTTIGGDGSAAEPMAERGR